MHTAYFIYVVGQLTTLSHLPTKDICVTICIGDVSKITCCGKSSWFKRRVTWNHPFLLWALLWSYINHDYLHHHPSSAHPTTSVHITICILPDELTLEWDKQLLGDHMVTDVASLLESGNAWKCIFYFHDYGVIVENGLGKVPRLSGSHATLSIMCKASDVLVSSMLF